MFVPTKAFFCKGVGFHKNELQSFELALRGGGIEKQNLVYVSSIFHPNCELIEVEQGKRLLKPGQITYCVMARNSTNENQRLAGASVGLAFPANRRDYGYISEHHCFGMEEKELGDLTEDMASTMLATTLGIEFDPEKDYDERKEIYLMSGQIVSSFSCPCTAQGRKGQYATVISSVVFLP